MPIAGGAGTTLMPAGDGNVISLGTQGTSTSTVPVSALAGWSVTTVAGEAVTPLAGGKVVVEGTTVRPGEAVTVGAGKVVSVAGNGEVVVEGSTVRFEGVRTTGSAAGTRESQAVGAGSAGPQTPDVAGYPGAARGEKEENSSAGSRRSGGRAIVVWIMVVMAVLPEMV